jgi:hypothetical protein
VVGAVPSPYLWRIPCRPTSSLTLYTCSDCETRCSLGREQNSGRRGGPSFYIAYTMSCQWCLLLFPICGDVVACQLDRLWYLWWWGRQARCLSTTNFEGGNTFILSSIGGIMFFLMYIYETFNVFHVHALYYTRTLITNKCTKTVLSSIVTHSHMFPPCWVIFRENSFGIVTLRLHFIVEWECAVVCVLRCFWRRVLQAGTAESSRLQYTVNSTFSLNYKVKP